MNTTTYEVQTNTKDPSHHEHRGEGDLPEGLWLLELAVELSDSSPELNSDVVSDSDDERMLRMR